MIVPIACNVLEANYGRSFFFDASLRSSSALTAYYFPSHPARGVPTFMPGQTGIWSSTQVWGEPSSFMSVPVSIYLRISALNDAYMHCLYECMRCVNALNAHNYFLYWVFPVSLPKQPQICAISARFIFVAGWTYAPADIRLFAKAERGMTSESSHGRVFVYMSPGFGFIVSALHFQSLGVC